MDVLSAAKEADPDVAVVVITGYASTHTAIKALRQGAHDYVTKPFDLWDVDKIVARGLENRRLTLENRRLLSDLQVANRELRRHEEILTEEVQKATRRLRTLYDVSRGVNASLEVTETLDFIVSQAVALTGARGGLLFRRRENTRSLEAAVTTGSAAALEEGAMVDVGEGITGKAVETSRPVRVRVGAPEELGEACLSRIGATEVLAVPMINQGNLVGVLTVVDREEGDFSDEDQELLESFASHAAVALANAELYEHTKILDRLKSDFVAVVSHEVRTPLTSIQGTLELVMDERYFSLEPKMREMLGICRTNVDRLRVLIGDILDFSKIEREQLPLDFGEVDPEALVRDTAAALSGIAQKRAVTVQVDVQAGLPVLTADRSRLEQVITNLVDNAIKFSDEGGTVTVRASAAAGEGVLVQVTDNGPGISASDLGKLFQKFQQVDPSLTRRQGGLGLGLVISKGIVEGHGGRIWVESEKGKGATFQFFVPVRPPRSEAPDAPAQAA